MRALVRAGEGPGYLAVAEVPDPVPAGDEALVKVVAASVNRGELRLLAMRPDGWRPGQDTAGVVVAAAADGSGPAVGTRVVAWVDQAGWAEFAPAPTGRMVALPDRVAPVAAATLPVAGVTALRLLRRGGALLGRRVLVTGAAGGVGRFAVELAAASGAEVTAVVSSPERATGLKDLGAAAVVFSPGEAAGRFDLILESVGGDSLAAMPGRLARFGVLVVFGNSSGERAPLAFGDFMESPDARLEVFRVYETYDPASKGEDLAHLVSLVAAGRLHPQVALEVPFTEAAPALAALAGRRVAGKVVLRFDRD